jgi:hypothetical protein
MRGWSFFDQRAKPPDLACADDLVGAISVSRPDLNDISPVVLKLPSDTDRRVEAIRRAHGVPTPVAKQYIPTRD